MAAVDREGWSSLGGLVAEIMIGDGPRQRKVDEINKHWDWLVGRVGELEDRLKMHLHFPCPLSQENDLRSVVAAADDLRERMGHYISLDGYDRKSIEAMREYDARRAKVLR